MQHWQKEFLKDKKLVATFEQSTTDAIHTIKRYVDNDQVLWETAITYTDRLVVRSGTVGDDGVTVYWGPWKTLHEVKVSL